MKSEMIRWILAAKKTFIQAGFGVTVDEGTNHPITIIILTPRK